MNKYQVVYINVMQTTKTTKRYRKSPKTLVNAEEKYHPKSKISGSSTSSSTQKHESVNAVQDMIFGAIDDQMPPKKKPKLSSATKDIPCSEIKKCDVQLIETQTIVLKTLTDCVKYINTNITSSKWEPLPWNIANKLKFHAEILETVAKISSKNSASERTMLLGLLADYTTMADEELRPVLSSLMLSGRHITS